jgi:putative IMPACT (imprinted ancient) family translation regulator
LLVRRQRGAILDEEFGGDVTVTLQFPVDSFEAFQDELRGISAGKLKVEVIESKETILRVRDADK